MCVEGWKESFCRSAREAKSPSEIVIPVRSHAKKRGTARCETGMNAHVSRGSRASGGIGAWGQTCETGISWPKVHALMIPTILSLTLFHYLPPFVCCAVCSLTPTPLATTAVTAAAPALSAQGILRSLTRHLNTGCASKSESCLGTFVYL